MPADIPLAQLINDLYRANGSSTKRKANVMAEDPTRLLQEVRAERDRQQHELGFGTVHDAAVSAAAWVAVLCRQAGLAIHEAGEMDDPARFRRQMIRVAATALAAVAAMDAKQAKVAGPPYERLGSDY